MRYSRTRNYRVHVNVFFGLNQFFIFLFLQSDALVLYADHIFTVRIIVQTIRDINYTEDNYAKDKLSV